jgi:hypothetical protein
MALRGTFLVALLLALITHHVSAGNPAPATTQSRLQGDWFGTCWQYAAREVGSFVVSGNSEGHTDGQIRADKCTFGTGNHPPDSCIVSPYGG